MKKGKKTSNINLFESHRLKLAVKVQNTLCLTVVIIRKMGGVCFCFVFFCTITKCFRKKIIVLNDKIRKNNGIKHGSVITHL